MQKQLIKTTNDGSCTIYAPSLDEHYHSIHGAIQEAKHIFINAGLRHYIKEHNPKQIHIFEVGFGTGLNAYLTLLESMSLNITIHYHTIEKYPLSAEFIQSLNYPEQLQITDRANFEYLHTCKWDKLIEITPNFYLYKQQADLTTTTFSEQHSIDLIYFDAFSPDSQPYMWTENIFAKLNFMLKPQGILTTYCVKGIVKQALRNTDFSIKRLPGPPGKLQILRASK